MNQPTGRRRRGKWWWLIAVLLVVVPLAEIYVLIQVGQVIGVWWTLVLLLADSILGSWLIKREGGRAWRALNDALARGQMPAKEIADGALILVGGTLMLSPGFVTDLAGILLILPFTRPLVRGVLTRVLARRMTVIGDVAAMTGQNPFAARQRPGPDPTGPVVQGEVVDD